MTNRGGPEVYTINENELLTKVYKYELKRNTEKFRIDVHEVLAGTIDDKFFAIPSLLSREERDVDPQFIGCGNTEQEALEDCLKKIKKAPLQIIIPPLV
jgi:precorrin-6B methylase 2